MEKMNPITRTALGNIASIGTLYDARQDIFTGLSIFKKSIPDEALTTTDADFSDIQLIHSDDFSDKFHKLDVKAELQVSVLAGLFKLEGSGHYLNDQKKSARTVKSSLLYNIKTKEENVNLYHENLRDAFAIDAIECGMATHVVVGISWGANSVLSCEYQNTDNKDVQEIEGSLSAELKKLSLHISGKVDVEYKDGEILRSSNFKIRMYGDVLPSKEDLPTDAQGALCLMKQMPSLVSKCNNGKGKPLTYMLVPITLLQKYLNFTLKSDAMLKTLEESSLLRVVRMFEELSKTQQRIHDFHEDAVKYRFCVEDGDFKKIASLKEELTIQESKLRSGEAEASELEELINEFQTGECSPQKVDSILSTWGELNEKINFARSIAEKGATYIGYGATLDEKILENLEVKTFVLYFKKDSAADTNVWTKNRQIFFQELQKKSEGCMACVVDCDIHTTLTPQGKSSCIQVVRDGQVLSEDLRLELEQLEGLPLVQATTGTMKIIHKPNKRVPLSIPCTGLNCGGDEEHDWICNKCKSILEWGFDQHVYCKCGMTPAALLEFKCPDPRHGIAFEKHDPGYFEALLANLTPFKELNILILGETGVGKSTWINAFMNFMKYSSLEEAEASDMVTLIPSSFRVYNENFEEVLVKTGDDKNETLEDGASATQEARIYSFNLGRTTIRLIDTPGIGDVRGVDQDKLNFQNIMDTLSHLEELHGVCILLMPNNARVGVMFRFCIQELLTHLHRDASKNIVFCFTNSRGTFYKPGNTMPVLRKLLSEKKGTADITLSMHTVYCYDSEAYRFLAAVKNDPPVFFPEEEKENFSQSWNKSIKETMRMLEHFRGLKPHPIQSTINLNQAREMILKLTKPLAEISRNIQTNKEIVKHEKNLIQKGNASIEELKSKLWTTRIVIEQVKLDHPKTVCSNQKCTQVRSLDGQNRTIAYTQVCHKNCYLRGVQADTIGDAGLLGCWAMNNGVCRHNTCGHSWNEHLHVYYDSKEVSKQVEDETIKEALANTTDAQEAKRQIMENKDKEIKEYEAELNEIQEASIVFAYFLKTNAITPYNDGMEMYLDHLIREEKAKVAAGGDSKTYDELVMSKNSYLSERDILEAKMGTKNDDGDSNSQITFTPEEIDKKVRHLKGLKHSGEKLREALECVNTAGKGASQSVIVNVPVAPKQTKRKGAGAIIKDFTAGVKKFWDNL